MANKYKISFDAELNIGQIKQAIATFQSNLNSLKVPDKILSPLTKDLGRLESEIKNFQALSSKTEFDKTEINELIKSYNTIKKLTREIGISGKEIVGLDLVKLLPQDALARFEKLQSILDGIASIDTAKSNLATDIDTWTKKAEELKGKIQETEKSLQDLQNTQKTNVLNKMGAEANTKNIQKEINELKKAQKDLIDARKNIPQQIKANEADILKKQKEIQALEKRAAELQTIITNQKNRAMTTGGPTTQAQINNEQSLEKKNAEIAKLQQEIAELKSNNKSLKLQETDATKLQVYKQREQQIESLTNKLAEAKIAESNYSAAVTKSNKDVANTAADLDKYKLQLTEVQTKLQELQNTDIEGAKLQEFRQALAEILQQDISTIPDNLQDLQQVVESLQGDQLEEVSTALEGLKQASEQTETGVDGLGKSVDGAREKVGQFDKQASEVEALKSRIQYFFGLSNAINLVKRAIRGAFDTIKELDKAMTETAVVTDFSVNDMWAQLPEYTKRANELGVTTLAAYEAATLYYQQGLKTNEVNALSVETLKMARIAGLDAAEATDRMTNALRGFNMELTTANAQRVDDVYSELAANTASNVDEISTAMTKVASLAHNANMEFETTAAFLAQIIETTRESAETAGTALKTVVARFSEVKKLVDEGTLRGTDEEGQAIDVNKVSQALRTAGIDMNQYFLGEVGLDDIFMELASKWDSLTALQQRYIATQAAGSRQQSRFIAMMSDYARTQELVGKAYNANGAAARQFEKTQASLESKLARLKNAWDEFLMGLTNNQVVKNFVDLLTNLLNTINKMTSAFDENTNTMLKWGVALGGIFAGRQLFKKGGLIDSFFSDTIFSNLLGGGAEDSEPSKIIQSASQLFKGGFFNNIAASFDLDKKALNSVLESTDIIDLASAFTELGDKIKAVGVSIKAAGASMKGFIATSWPILAIVAAVAGFAALTNYNEQTKARRSDPTIGLKEQVNEAKKFADQMSDLRDQTSEVAKQWNDISTQQSANLQAIHTADSVSAYRDSIKAQNDYIESLIEKDAQYSQYVSQIEGLNGEIILTLDEDALANAAQKAAEAATKAAANSYLAESLVLSSSNALRDAQINAIESRYYEQDGKYYRRNGNQNDFSVVVNSITGQASTVATTPVSEEISEEEYRRVQAQLGVYKKEQQEGEFSQLAAQAYREAGQSLGISNSNLNLASQVLGQIFDPDAYKEEVEDLVNRSYRNGGLAGLSNEQLRNLYEEQYGVQYTGDPEGLAKAIAQGVIYEQQFSYRPQAVSDFLDSSSGARQLAEAFAGNIEITTDNIDILKYADEFAKALHIDETTFATELAKSQQIVARKKTNAASTYYNSMMQAGTLPTYGFQQIAKDLSLEDWNHLNSIVENLQGTLSSPDLANYLNIIPAQTSEEIAKIDTFLRGFDLSSPISAAQQLGKALSTATDGSVFKQLLIDLKQTNKELFTASSLVQSFTLTDEYTNLTETLSDFIKENGEISAENIEELAKSSKNLQFLLDQDEISATGLAKALTLLENNEITIDSLTDRVLTFLSSIDSVENRVSSLQNRLANFDKGLDYGEGSDFFVGLADELDELIKGYEFGNDRLIKMYEEFAGEGSYWDLIDQYWNDDPEAFAKIVQSRIDQMRTAIDKNSYSFMNAFAGNANLGISRINGSQYDFEWDTKGRTYDEMITSIQEEWSAANGYEIGRDYAEALLQGWLAQSPETRAEINKNNYNAALEDLVANAKETGYIATEELEAAAAAYGKKIEQIRADIAANGLDIPIEISWSGKAGDDLFSEWDKIKDQFDFPMLEEGVLDFEGAMQLLQSTGMSAAQAMEILNKKVEDSNDTLELGQKIITGYNDDGSVMTETYTNKTGEALQYNVAEALDARNFSAQANAIAESLGKSIADNLVKAITGAEDDGNSLAQATGKNMYNALVTAWTDFAAEVANSTLSPNIDFGGGGQGGNSGGVENPGGAAGGIVKSFAGGSANNYISPGFALTGEEGPEIIWNKNEGYAYVTGRNGPEFQNLQPGDRVFNAAETSRIFRNSSFARGGIFGSYGSGGYNRGVVDPSNGGGGSGSGSNRAKKESTWRNELDWLYDLMEDIAEYERQQTILQSKYDLALQDLSKTGRDLFNLTRSELINLETQLEAQSTAQLKRLQQMGELQTQVNAAGYGKYVQWNQRDQTLEIDWDKIEAITNKERYDEVTDWISRMEEVQDQIDDAEDAIWDIKEQIQELQNRYLEKYLDFQSKVLDALVAQYQATIDNLSELNDTLNDTNANILDSIQKEIDLERQIRDNTDTEKQLSDLEARIAYLQRDTSGANDVEIRTLQKQLDEAREDYTDTLIDQSVERLQEANDTAAKQREKQIELMQAQLDYWQESGGLWGEVADLMATGFNGNGSIIEGSDLWNLLRNADEWDSLSEAQKKNWANELILEANEVGAHLIQLSNGNSVDAEKVRQSIADERGVLTENIAAAAETVRASIGSLQGLLGGTPEHSYTATKTDGYASGGTATSTAMALLHGTPQEPEYVLNARQTDAFLRLADILPAALGNTNTISNNYGGNTTFNVEVSVGSISNDYDVDNLVARIKEDLYDAATYRNGNALGFLR